MKIIPRHFLLGLISIALLLNPSGAAESTAGPTRNTYVIVHGAWGGGWDWKNVDRLLSADGNTVYRPTLTGLGERAHLSSPAIGLSTHIDDIVNVILCEDLHDVVLVGHSYGGIVITGVMDRIPERVKHAIFLDAVVPEDGESVYDIWKLLGRERYPEKGGFIVPEFIDFTRPAPSERPQPLKTWTDPVSYKNPAARKIPATLVWLKPQSGSEDERFSLFEPIWHRLDRRGWPAIVFDSDHLVERTHPKELTALLERLMKEAAKRPNSVGRP